MNNNNAINWLIEHSEPMHDDNGNAIPNSGSFSGTLPGRMAQQIRSHLESENVSSRDTAKRVYYNWRDGDTGYSVSFGTYHSTANAVQFNYCPDRW